MATKTYCDACGAEGHVHKFEYLCHIDDVLNKRDKYVDNKGNPISGRYVHKDLCIACYNGVMLTAVKRLKYLQEESDMIDPR